MEVSYWENLNTFLAKALHEPTRQLEQELYYQLEDAKPQFLALLDVPPRNSSEEAEPKTGKFIHFLLFCANGFTGKATISGVQKTYNNDFVQVALFLAQQLECSECYVARILDHVLSDDPVESALRAVQQFYTSRQHVLATLQLILDSAMGMDLVKPSTGFSSDLYAQVVSALQSECQQLSNLLFVLAGSGELHGTCLAALDASSQLVAETSFVGLMKTELAKSTWRIPEMKAVITIKWCLFLIETSNGNNRIDAYSEADIEKLITDSVCADVFRYLSILLHTSRPLEAISQHTLKLEYDPLPPAAPIDGLFYKYLLRQVEILLMVFVTSLSPILRRMRHADEDTTSPTASCSQAPQTNPHPSCLADFFTLIALVYSDQPPDEGLKWWDNHLYAFLWWSAKARVPSLLKLLYNILGSLARGQSCTTYAYNFFSMNGDWLLSSIPDQRAVDSTLGGRERQPLPVDPEEIWSIMAFLHVLRVVVRYSTAAHAAMLESGQYRAVVVMLDLVRSHIALELQGKLLDTLAAFCDGPEVGSEVARLMWASIEQSEVLPVRSTTTRGRWKENCGVPAELEEIEA
ncbi:hypothetical protein FRC11_010691 [Ceratobasidium sp. 423]|nr:hypothetical protein FRC11_010691 [Ceratobasidium sp. 423]